MTDSADVDKRSPAVADPSGGADAKASEVYDGLDFDRAVFDQRDATSHDTPSDAGPAAATGATTSDFSCRSCGNGIQGEYFTLGDHALCPACRQKIAEELRRGSGSFAHALGLGALAAAGGAALYYAVAAITGYELGIIAILVGYLVGKAVRKGAGTQAHWGYRALGFGLTWVSIAATYMPAILQGMGGGTVSAFGAGTAFVFALVAPFFLLVHGEIMAVIILAIGLWEGWRYSAAPIFTFKGPFRLGGAPADPAAVPKPEP